MPSFQNEDVLIATKAFIEGLALSERKHLDKIDKYELETAMYWALCAVADNHDIRTYEISGYNDEELE